MTDSRTSRPLYLLLILLTVTIVESMPKEHRRHRHSDDASRTRNQESGSSGFISRTFQHARGILPLLSMAAKVIVGGLIIRRSLREDSSRGSRRYHLRRAGSDRGSDREEEGPRAYVSEPTERMHPTTRSDFRTEGDSIAAWVESQRKIALEHLSRDHVGRSSWEEVTWRKLGAGFEKETCSTSWCERL